MGEAHQRTTRLLRHVSLTRYSLKLCQKVAVSFKQLSIMVDTGLPQLVPKVKYLDIIESLPLQLNCSTIQ